MSASASNDILLPKTRQGEVDWNALGKIVVDYLLAESLCVSQVDSKYGAECAADVIGNTPPDTYWKFDYEKDGIVVFRKNDKNPRLTCFSGRGVVNAPYRVVAEFVKDTESSFLWDKFLVESKYLKTFAQTSTYTDLLGQQVFSASHCLSIIQRDILCFMRCHYQDGKYIQSAISVEDKDYPPVRFRPRCDVHLGTGFVVEPYRGSSTTSLITYFGNVDIKGIPMFLTNQVKRRHPMAIQGIQRNFSHRPPSPQLSPSPPHLSPSTQPPPSLTHPTMPYEEDLSLNLFMGKGHLQSK